MKISESKGTVQPKPATTEPANVKTDDETKRTNRLWRIYCARVAAYDQLREMRTLKKYMHDAFNEAVTALEVFEEEISKLGGCNVK